MASTEKIRFEEPGFATFLFASVAAAWIWLSPFVCTSGTNGRTPATTRCSAIRRGSAAPSLGLRRVRGVAGGQGEHPAVDYGWYAAFLRW